MDTVSGVDPLQVQVVFHALTQVGEGFGVDLGHQEQGRAGDKVVPGSYQAAAPAACLVAFFDHRDLIAATR